MSNKVTSDKEIWFKVALGGVLISLVSLFTPIIIFNTHSGKTFYYNIIDIVTGSKHFAYNMVKNYYGPIIWDLDMPSIIFLAALGVIAMLCAIIGLITLRVQRPNTINFILTVLGLIGIMVPSVVVYALLLLRDYFSRGEIYLGVAPIISPIALLVSILAVVRRKNKVQQEIFEEARRKNLIRPAGDLE